MPSTYTQNTGIEKIGIGEQVDTWGPTTNTNFDIVDQALNGVASITVSATGSTGAPNALPITDAALSVGRNRFIEFVDAGDLGGTVYYQLTPNDAQKIVHFRNSLSGNRSVVVFQGTYNASRDYEIPNGRDVMLKFGGEGASATVVDVYSNLKMTAIDTATFAVGGVTVTATAAELNYTDGVTSNIQTQLNAKQATITGAATSIVSSDLTVSRALVSDDSGKVAVSSATAAELGYLSGVTSSVQAQLDAKGTTITGAATSIVSSDLTVSRALLSDESGKVAVSAATTTELGYLSGVTSAIQTQLNALASGSGLPGLWTFTLSGNDLQLRYNGTPVFKLTTNGTLTLLTNVGKGVVT